ncbi:MAG: LysM peptidoglycan-binding domain-containing protein [Clostridiales bacterium]|nr:LysM peptidoglycan-binding domain-containing protein [Clostridiales bacterium]
MIHIVKQGDTLFSIAARYGVSVQRLIYDNQVPPDARLVVGQALLVLIPETVHIVKQGETLIGIARQYGVPLNDIVKNNPSLILQQQIYPGDTLAIRFVGQQDNNFSVNGYAYPFINRNTLLQTIPYLTELSVFSYGFTPNGELIPTEDEYLLSLAKAYGVDPILVLTPRSGEEAFDNGLINELVNNPAAVDNIINNLIITMLQKGYSGVNLDFEYIMRDNRQAYSDFAGKLRNAASEYGLKVSVALAPKTSSDQPGLLYEGIDYAQLGANTDSVLLMTYEWGYTYGPPMAVAPIGNVRRVLEYGLSQIPNYKIDLGVPNYGYDWPLPFIQGQTAARTIGNNEAVEIARRTNSVILYDEPSQTPYFEYTENGVDHVVWFEDVRSLQGKIDLIIQYNLRGLGYWNLLRYFRSNWLLLNMY